MGHDGGGPFDRHHDGLRRGTPGRDAWLGSLGSSPRSTPIRRGSSARIVLSGLPPIRGETMAAKKQYMQEHLDGIRALLMREPRGHRDLFGVILTPSTTAWGEYGVLFIDNAGYIDMCGHGIRSWARSPQARTGNVNLASDDPRLRGQRVLRASVDRPKHRRASLRASVSSNQRRNAQRWTGFRSISGEVTWSFRRTRRVAMSSFRPPRLDGDS